MTITDLINPMRITHAPALLCEYLKTLWDPMHAQTILLEIMQAQKKLTSFACPVCCLLQAQTCPLFSGGGNSGSWQVPWWDLSSLNAYDRWKIKPFFWKYFHQPKIKLQNSIACTCKILLWHLFQQDSLAATGQMKDSWSILLRLHSWKTLPCL